MESDRSQLAAREMGGFILRRQSFDADLISYVFSPDGKKIHYFFNKQESSIKQTGETYRTINHWDSVRLLSVDRGEGHGWRKFSILDIIWVYILGDLRGFGFPLEKLQFVKKCLLKPLDNSVTLLEFYVATAKATSHDSECFVLVTRDGVADIATRSELESTEIAGRLPKSYVKVRLNDYVERVSKKQGIVTINEPSLTVSKKELDLLLAVRKGDFQTIEVRLENGEIKRLAGTQSVNKINDKKIWETLKEMLSNGDFQDITLKQRDGSVVLIQRTIKDP
ncbi:MAG: MerR family transcriptional regulator [bacterium]|nr:MerR family transcriptional regulator [bacterium]